VAKLTVPTRAIGFKKGKPGKRKMPKTGKYHLLKHGNDPNGEGFTVCNAIVWGEDRFQPDEHGFRINGKREESYEIVDISSITTEKLCKKCLGPMKAED